MAVTKYQYILGSFFLSLISVACLIGAYISQNWVVGESTTSSPDKTNLINYGLFKGTFEDREFATSKKSPIYVICSYKDNACAFSCKESSEVRKKELLNILGGNISKASCDDSFTQVSGSTENDIVWTNSGVYVCTLIFLSLAVLTAALSTIFGIYNTTNNPVETLIAVYGLKIWNMIAACSDLMVLLFYGIHYATNVKDDNISFIYLHLDTTTDLIKSEIGYSYWLVLGSLICHCVGFGLLFLRSWLIAKEPPPPIINIEKTDDTIFLY